MQRSLEQHSRYLDSLMRNAAALPAASAAKPAPAADAPACMPMQLPVSSAADAAAPLAATDTHFGSAPFGSAAADDTVALPLGLLPGVAGGGGLGIDDDAHIGDAGLAGAGSWPLMGPGEDDVGLGNLADGVTDWF